MRDRNRLGGLENDQLLAALSALVQREHELLSDFLAHLAELDERRLFRRRVTPPHAQVQTPTPETSDP